MFTFDRDTAMIVAIVMCIAASVYMYRELKTTKEEMEGVKGMNGKMSSFLSRIRPIQIPQTSSLNEPVTPKNVTFKTENETQVEDESEENQESEEDSSE